MAYLNLDLDYFNHVKTKRLVEMLGRNTDAVLPIRLWAYCAKHHAEDGRLSGYSAHEIETICAWKGREGRAVDAMVRAGFVEKTDDGFQVHDWLEHAGHLAAFKRRAKSAAKERWRRYALSCAKRKTSIASTGKVGKVKPSKVNKKKGSESEGGEVRVLPQPEFMKPLWDLWEEFKKMRHKIRYPMTQKAEELNIRKLMELHELGNDSRKVLEQSIMNSWRGLFPLDSQRKTKTDEVTEKTKDLFKQKFT